jgi:hypothetical protein
MELHKARHRRAFLFPQESLLQGLSVGSEPFSISKRGAVKPPQDGFYFPQRVNIGGFQEDIGINKNKKVSHTPASAGFLLTKTKRARMPFSELSTNYGQKNE